MHEKRIIPIILAGGEGTRLWPLSNAALPKPFLDIQATGRTLLEQTLERVVDDNAFHPPVLLCHENYAALAQETLSRMRLENGSLLTESTARNTAPAIALACRQLLERHRADAVVAFLPADHHFEDPLHLAKLLAQGLPSAAAGNIVLFGADIMHPSTGHGYIRKGIATSEHCHAVAAFIEKPDAANAAIFAASPDYFWNCGIILSRLDTLIAALAERFPAYAQGEPVESCIPALSIDVALLQHIRNGAVIPAGNGWADVGSWNDVWSTSPQCADGNAAQGEAHLHASSNCLVASHTGQRISVLGGHDLVIIATDSHILVADRKQAQHIARLSADPAAPPR